MSSTAQLYGLQSGRPSRNESCSVPRRQHGAACFCLLCADIQVHSGEAPWRQPCLPWHPLQVESVAWVAERKDVLSTFFWLLTLLAYGRYARSRLDSQTSSPQRRYLITKSFYGLTLMCFALGLLSKPMLVTLPFTLLLLDYWPLRRLPAYDLRSPRAWKPLILEKLPFFALAAASCLMTFMAQRAVAPVISPRRSVCKLPRWQCSGFLRSVRG